MATATDTPETDGTTIAIEALTKRFGTYAAVDDVDLEIGPGVYGLLGPNGAGKSTLMNIVVGKMRPTAGTVRVLTSDIAESPLTVRRNVGYLPDNIGFYDHLSGTTNLEYLGRLQGLDAETATEEANRLLERVDLVDARDDPVGTYSAGMRQRLGVAQALIDTPPVLLLDEPTAELDPVARQELLDLVRAYADEGRTVLISTHVLPEIVQIADRFSIIQAGELIAESAIADVDDLLAFYTAAVRGE